MGRAALIRPATIEDLPNLGKGAREFMESTKFLEVNQENFMNTWVQLINSGLGVIFILGEYDGALGAMYYPDPNSGKLMATEMFWFVSPEKRGNGLALFDEYEKWAKEKGCEKALMVHLADSMPDRLQSLYKRRGYELMESHYCKEL
jgi:GNAT superfamily N-acetyltransferase